MKPLSFLVVMALGVLTLAGVVIMDGWCDPVSQRHQLDNARLVEVLMITDLALWTEARYTRHPSQADCFTAFQNGPTALDYFPSGTWVRPNRHQQDSGKVSVRNK